MGAGLVRGQRQPIAVRPQAMLEARDLPRCDISDYLQHRIDTAVREEHVARAKEQGLPPKQVSLLVMHSCQAQHLSATVLASSLLVNKR